MRRVQKEYDGLDRFEKVLWGVLAVLMMVSAISQVVMAIC